MKQWKRKATKRLLDHPWLIINEDQVELPDGSVIEYLVFPGGNDYVTVLAVQAGRIAMVRELAYPINRPLLQFPEGSIDDGETILQAARRELLEETGIESTKLAIIGDNLSNHRRTTARNHIVVAGSVRVTGNPQHEATEAGMELVWYAEAEIDRLIAQHEIVQKNTLAAWALFRAVGSPGLRDP